MSAQVPSDPETAPHIPVLLAPIMAAIAPVSGVWLDGTFGAGGYTRALLDAGAERVLAVDRDPDVFRRAERWAGTYGARLVMIAGEFLWRGRRDRCCHLEPTPRHRQFQPANGERRRPPLTTRHLRP